MRFYNIKAVQVAIPRARTPVCRIRQTPSGSTLSCRSPPHPPLIRAVEVLARLPQATGQDRAGFGRNGGGNSLPHACRAIRREADHSCHGLLRRGDLGHRLAGE